MSILQKMKRDSKYRIKVFLLVMLGFIVLSGIETQKSDIDCDQYNNFGNYIGTTTAFNECVVECVAQYNHNPTGWSDLSSLWADKVVSCVNTAATGKYVQAQSLAEAKSMCAGGMAGLYDDNWFRGDVYLCKQTSVEGVCDSEFQSSIGGILDSVWESNTFECKTKFYVVAFGGGFIGLILLMAAI